MRAKNRETISDDKEKAETLNKGFCSVSVTEQDDSQELDGKRAFLSPFTDVIITKKMLIIKVLEFERNKSPEFNGIHPSYLLKELTRVVAKQLELLFNTFLNERKLPLDWK